MIAQRPLIAERALASHCPELLRQGPSPEELLARLGKMGERLARRLAGALAPMLGGEAPLIMCGPTRQASCAEFGKSIGRLAANSLLGVGGDAPLLISIEAAPVLRIVDRAFGGKGEAPSPLPTSFPMAAELMIGRIEALFMPHLAAAVAAVADEAPAPAQALAPLRRDGSLTLLAPFAEDADLAVLSLEVDDGTAAPWLITLALPLSTLARLFGFPDPAPGGPPRNSHLGDPSARPFAALPLDVSAVLVDMALPFAALAGLHVGQVLSVAVARSVPLRIGETTIAHGTIGAVDEHVAIQITRAF